MLNLINAEGSKFNTYVDNYLVLQVVNYEGTEFNDLDSLLKTIETFHTDFVTIETDDNGYTIIDFMENIDKLIIFNHIQVGLFHYIKVQRNLLMLDMN